MKCRSVSHVLRLLLALLVMAGCRSRWATSATPTPLADEDVSALAQELGNLKARGIVRPAQALELGFRTSGTVNSVAAEVGMAVQAGDTLAELDTNALEFELKRAREAVEMGQTRSWWNKQKSSITSRWLKPRLP
jgi:multidrug efflux pump subunit AcrA (membrane-fusion protein)